jgi:hypothetical protein
MIYLIIYIIGYVLCYLRYVAMWNDYRHIPITYFEVCFISLTSLFGFILTLPYYFRPKRQQQLFDYKLRF